MVFLQSIMLVHRNLLWFACAQLFLTAASQPVFALQISDYSAIVAKRNSLALLVTGRKGTRNYIPDDIEVPDDVEISEALKENAAQPEQTAKSRLDQCLASWDKATHITQYAWHQICVREIKANE